jgi:hypothetical protein
MLVKVRSLLSFLLVLAIPLQGIAANTMVFCKTTHHASQTAKRSIHQTSVQAQSHNMLNEADAKTSDHANHPRDAARSSQCSACHFCCHFSALPSYLSIEVAPPTASDIPIFTTSAPLGPVLAGLKRPPRLLLA